MVTEIDPRSSVTICIEATLLGLIIFAAVMGNTLILASLYRFSCLQTKTNAFVLNLAIADMFLAVLAMPFTLVSSIKYDWIFGNVMCQTAAVLNSIFCEASIMTLAFVSLERFLAIVYPLKYETLVTLKRVKMVIFYIWFQAVVCASSTFVFSRYTFLKFESICTVDWGYKIGYTLMFAIVFLYVPFLVTAVLYCLILNTAMRQRRKIEVMKIGGILNDRKTIKRRNNDENGVKKTRKEHKATVMIAIVVGTFCVCWFPHSVGVFCILRPNCQWDDSFFVATTWLAMLNSALNSLIYGLMNRSFRRAFRSVIFCERYVGNADLITNILQDIKDKRSNGNVPIDYSKAKE